VTIAAAVTGKGGECGYGFGGGEVVKKINV
jgi:hypothetical protein